VKCQLGVRKFTDQEKQTNPYLWNDCNRRNGGGVFYATDAIAMRTGGNGQNPILSVTSTTSPLYPYFSGIPKKYYQYVDSSDLGESFSYVYEYSGLLRSIFQGCSDASSSSSSGSQADIFLSKDELEPIQHENGSLTYEANLIPEDLENTSEQLAELYDAVVESTSSAVIPDIDIREKEVLSMAQIDLERMICMYQAECRGGVRDFTDKFRRNMGVKGSSRCTKILKSNVSVLTPEWRKMMSKFYPDCSPSPLSSNAASQ